MAAVTECRDSSEKTDQPNKSHWTKNYGTVRIVVSIYWDYSNFTYLTFSGTSRAPALFLNLGPSEHRHAMQDIRHSKNHPLSVEDTRNIKFKTVVMAHVRVGSDCPRG